MKKILLLILTLIMVLTMAACGDSDKDTDTNSQDAPKTEAVSNDKADESEDDGLLSEEEALELAKEYWQWEEYTENGELVNYKSTQIDSDGEVVSGYYTFYLQWWNDGKWEDVDVVNVNRETGKCTYTLNGESVSR